MFFRLFLLFTLVPALELYLIIKVSQVIGAFNTLLIIIFTGVLGAFYARQQGVRVMTNIHWEMSEGRLPGDELINGAMLLVGGAFLITPGFLTDITGFALIFPLTRDIIKGSVTEFMRKRIDKGEIRIYKA
ncbi:MAG: FxsA family protein [bacterium]